MICYPLKNVKFCNSGSCNYDVNNRLFPESVIINILSLALTRHKNSTLTTPLPTKKDFPTNFFSLNSAASSDIQFPTSFLSKQVPNSAPCPLRVRANCKSQRPQHYKKSKKKQKKFANHTNLCREIAGLLSASL